MAYQTKQIHLHSRIAIPARALNKTSFTSEQMNKYLLTTVGKVIFNNMFPEDFPYLNEVSEANFHATPDKFFLEMGKDIREAIAESAGHGRIQEERPRKDHRRDLQALFYRKDFPDPG